MTLALWSLFIFLFFFVELFLSLLDQLSRVLMCLNFSFFFQKLKGGSEKSNEMTSNEYGKNYGIKHDSPFYLLC